jgi:hypothetical protein
MSDFFMNGVDLRKSAAIAVGRDLNPIGRKLTQIFAVKSFSSFIICVNSRESAAEVHA